MFTKALVIALAAAAAAPWAGASSGGLDKILGSYLFSKSMTGEGEIVKRRPGASIAVDRIHVAPLKRDFRRYLFIPSPPREGQAPMVVLTIYEAENGDLFSFMWDGGSLTTEAHFRDESFLRNLFKSGESWVGLERKGRTLRGVFYPDDRGSRVRFAVELGDGFVEIVSREPSNWGLPLKVVERFDRR